MVKIDDPTGSVLAAREPRRAPTRPTTRRSRCTSRSADATWPFILTHGAGAIVDARSLPGRQAAPRRQGRRLRPVQAHQVHAAASRPSSRPTQVQGRRPARRTTSFIIQYFDQASALKLAIEQGDVDVAYRSLSPTDIEALRKETDKGVQGRRRQRHRDPLPRLQLKKKPVDNKRRPPGVRPAHRPRRDREERLQGHGRRRCTRRSRQGSPARRSRSRTPTARAGQGQGQGDPRRGRREDPGAGQRSGTPRPTTARSVDELHRDQAPARRERPVQGHAQVDRVGPVPEGVHKADSYPIYQLGWFPDFPDADNYSAPVPDGKGGFFKNNYINPPVNDADRQGAGQHRPGDARRERSRRSRRSRPTTCR